MNYKFDGNRVFFTSDTHFNHTNIIRFCNRPFKDVSHMNETIISNWNRVVGSEDIVFHLGDFCLGGSAEWINVLNRLNGKIYLISGNHDIKNLRQNYTKYFEHIAMKMYNKRVYYENFMCRLTLNGESHEEERVYTLSNFTPFFTKEEKLQTAKSVLLFLLYVNEPHIKAYLKPEVVARIESWKREENGWISTESTIGESERASSLELES